MGIHDELKMRENEVFPHNKIILLDGRILDCYPIEAPAPDKIADDHFELDTTGRYLRIGNQKPQPLPPEPKEVEERRQLFIQNAFYLLAHKERIMSDSRMFLCHVAVQSGLAYTGTSGFKSPTLGVYLEWWSLVDEAMRMDSQGRKSLVYHLAGSPLSGMNKCMAVREDGELEKVELSSFGSHWRPFTYLNQRYARAKQMYEAYTLQEVLDILTQEDGTNTDYANALEVQFMTHKIEQMNKHIAQIKEERDMWHDKHNAVLARYNADIIRKFYAEYEVFKAQTDKEIEQLKEQKRALKAEQKSGRLDNKSYQKQLTPLKNRMRDLDLRISCYHYSKVREAFPDESAITFDVIAEFVESTRNGEG